MLQKDTSKNSSEEPKIYSVSEINNLVKNILEDSIPLLEISGEISNLVQPSSGHIYFSLKDDKAQVRCAMFRTRNGGLKFQPKNGMHIVVAAQITLYEPRGDYQLIVLNMREAGEGVLHEKFLQLKAKLEKEGLFASERKKTFPKIPKCIGVVTSPTGAAIRDILSVLQRRSPSITVIIYPTQVQGNEAAKQIANAIELANQRKECDVLIIARGGGSLEDLWPFNEEIVARAIFDSKIPTISGVGHEIDFTIADFVADKRAPTPSAAAELITPNQEELLTQVTHLQKRLTSLMQHKLSNSSFQLTNLQHRLKHPAQILQQQSQRTDDLELRLKLAISRLLQTKQHKLAAATQTLDLVSPLATLHRGYAIVTHNDKIVRKTADVQIGDVINTRLDQGNIECEVLKTYSK